MYAEEIWKAMAETWRGLPLKFSSSNLTNNSS